LFLIGLFWSGISWGQFQPNYNCYNPAITENNSFYVYPGRINVPFDAEEDSLIGEWIAKLSVNYDNQFLCVDSKTAALNIPATQRFYTVAEMPPSAYFVNKSINAVAHDGEVKTFDVATTSWLQQRGLGYILQWRIIAEKGPHGPWRVMKESNIPDAEPDISSQPYFYQGRVSGMLSYRCRLSLVGYYNTRANGFSSYSEYIAYVNNSENINSVCFYFQFNKEVAIRYVLIEKISALRDKLNEVSWAEPEYTDYSSNNQLILFGSQPEANQNNKSLYYHYFFRCLYLSPWGTCTTPSLSEATQNFNMVFASAIPNPGNMTAQRDFNFTLTNCPRVNIRYYAHANGKWVNSSQGIVGMSGSTPHANPVVGNPRGFGIRLQHRTGGHQHSGNVHIHTNEVANPPTSQSYTRNWQGAGTTNTSTGVTHTIPLRASVIRTNPSNTPIQPGPFNTSVVFVISYP